MRYLKLTIAYDGSAYHGWQVQPEARGNTVQGVLEKALAELTGQEAMRATAASRTDAGVHAWGQVVSISTDSKIPVEKFPLALNTFLPPDLVARQAEEVHDGFHARFDVRQKTYRYTIYRAEVPNPFWRRYACFMPRPLDVEGMREAASQLVGTHDFSSFCAARGAASNFIRTVYESKVIPKQNLLYITISANGFLYNMVRIIVGTLLEVGKGRRQKGSLLEALAARERAAAGETAPPQGLCLLKVDY